MAGIVFALYPSEKAADPAIRELTRACDEHRMFSVQSHDKAPLDANYLPDDATEFARNTVLSMIIGAVAGGVLGGIVGAFIDFPGLGPGLIAIFTALTGVCVAFLSATQAGSRKAKEPLLELERHLGDGTVLLTVQYDTGTEADVIEDVLAEHGGEDLGRC